MKPFSLTFFCLYFEIRNRYESQQIRVYRSRCQVKKRIGNFKGWLCGKPILHVLSSCQKDSDRKAGTSDTIWHKVEQYWIWCVSTWISFQPFCFLSRVNSCTIIIVEAIMKKSRDFLQQNQKTPIIHYKYLQRREKWKTKSFLWQDQNGQKSRCSHN